MRVSERERKRELRSRTESLSAAGGYYEASSPRVLLYEEEGTVQAGKLCLLRLAFSGRGKNIKPHDQHDCPLNEEKSPAKLTAETPEVDTCAEFLPPEISAAQRRRR